MSRILILSLNYTPEPTGFAPHTAALAEHLVGVGHQVTVLTGFPFAPRWRRYEDYRGKFTQRETLRGVEVIRITHFIPRVPGRFLDRILMEGTFAAVGACRILARRLSAGRSYDVVIYVGAQPAIAWLGRSLAAIFGAAYIAKITDLAAQAALDVGIVRSAGWGRLLERVEYSAYRPAGAAIVLCDAFRQALIAHGYPAQSIHVVRDSIDLNSLRPSDEGPRFRAAHGIPPDAFVVLYSGSLGLKQGLSHVPDAAKLLADCPDVRWVIVGEGETRRSLESLIKDHGLTEIVRLLPLQPEAEMSAMFGAADVLLLSQLRTVKDTVIPSKLLTYMACGRPVLAAINAASQAAEIMREAQNGILVAPESAAALADGVRELRARRADCADMARRSRAYAEQHFDRTRIVLEQQRVIEQALPSNASRTAIT